MFKNDPCQLLPPHNEIVSRLPLVSAYASIGEPKYTNYTGQPLPCPALPLPSHRLMCDVCVGCMCDGAGHFVGVLDYIFYSKAHLNCLGCLDVDNEAHLKKETALPNAQFASDHISLVSELDWLD